MKAPLDFLDFESPRTPIAEDHEMKQKQAEELQEAKKKQSLARQAKVMAQFQQQQQNFLDNQESIDWGEDCDDVESVATGTTEEQQKIWKYPTGNCILCQEETNDSRLYGTFALMMNSNILRQTNFQDSDFVGEVLSTPSSLDHSAEAIRPFGISGQNRRKVSKLSSDGQQLITEHQDLGKGFPAQYCRRGPVSTGCGHIMHYACFELYCGATQRRQHNQIDRNHPERIEQKEFVCPLCKALGNTFIPIIWKGKEEQYPGALQTELPFTEWLQSSLGLAVSRFYKHANVEDAKSSGRYQELFVDYTARAVITPLTSRLIRSAQPRLTSPTSPGSAYQMPAFCTSDDGHIMIAPPESPLLDDLVLIYARLRETIKSNGLASRFSEPANPINKLEDLVHGDTLARTLGFSIAATEIAQRGVQSEPGRLLLDKIPPLTLAHLRMLSETASSYIAIEGMMHSGSNHSTMEFSDAISRQLFQLFAGHPHIVGTDTDSWNRHRLPSALPQDAFVLLAECSIYLVPAFNLDIHNVIQVCYLLEIVKVAINLVTTGFNNMIAIAWDTDPEHDGHGRDAEIPRVFNDFIGRIRSFLEPGWPDASRDLPPTVSRRFYSAIATYALPFLRKVTILLHVRYGVDFPEGGLADIEEPELDRLTKALRLPSLPSLFEMVEGSTGGRDSILAMMLAGWIEHWKFNYKTLGIDSAAIRCSHPAILELIGLPVAYDTLTYEATRRRCPTTGKEMVDPTVCLFCGDIFCSQAMCCHQDGKGGCNQHMRK